MKLNAKFSEYNRCFTPQFGEVYSAPGDEFDKGYSAGLADGLAERKFETWVVTYVDGTVEEVKVATL